MSPLPENCVIDSAFLKFVVFWGTSDNPKNVLDLFLNSSDWDEETLKWGAHPETTGESFGGIVNCTSPKTNHRWNVTDGVKKQLAGENYGFTTIPQNSGSVYSANAYTSEGKYVDKRPSLTIHYRLDSATSTTTENGLLNNNHVKFLKLSRNKLSLMVGKAGAYNLRLYNSIGQLVSSLENINLINGVNKIDISKNNLSHGIYVINVKNKDFNFSKTVCFK